MRPHARPSSFAGLTVSKVLPDFAATHFPPIKRRLGFLRKSKAALFLAPAAALSTDTVAAAMAVLLVEFLTDALDNVNLGDDVSGLNLCLICRIAHLDRLVQGFPNSLSLPRPV